MELKKYQSTYDGSNMQIPPPILKPFDLTPQWHKHLFTLDVDPSPILHGKSVFQALTNVNWNLDPQIQEASDSTQDKPEASIAGGGVSSRANPDITEASLQE